MANTKVEGEMLDNVRFFEASKQYQRWTDLKPHGQDTAIILARTL